MTAGAACACLTERCFAGALLTRCACAIGAHFSGNGRRVHCASQNSAVIRALWLASGCLRGRLLHAAAGPGAGSAVPVEV